MVSGAIYLVKIVNVAVPTFNRASDLVRILGAFDEIGSKCPQVRFFIYDNCSTDRTEVVVKDWLDSSPLPAVRLNYIKREKNLGLDQNVLGIAEDLYSDDCFTWILCDDDVLYPGMAIDLIHELSFIDEDLVVAKFSEPLGLDVRNDFFRISFLPALIVRGRPNSFHHLLELVGTNYIHLSIVNAIFPKKVEPYVSDQVVGMQTPNVTFRFSYFQTFVLGYARCLAFDSPLSRQEYKSAAWSRAKSYLFNFLLDKAAGTNFITLEFSWRDALWTFRLYKGKSFIIFGFLFGVMAFPNWFLKICFRKRVRQYIFDKDRKIEYLNNLKD